MIQIQTLEIEEPVLKAPVREWKCLGIAAALAFVLDIYTDLTVVSYFYIDGELEWFAPGLTAICLITVFPAIFFRGCEVRFAFFFGLGGPLLASRSFSGNPSTRTILRLFQDFKKQLFETQELFFQREELDSANKLVVEFNGRARQVGKLRFDDRDRAIAREILRLRGHEHRDLSPLIKSWESVEPFLPELETNPLEYRSKHIILLSSDLNLWTQEEYSVLMSNGLDFWFRKWTEEALRSTDFALIAADISTLYKVFHSLMLTMITVLQAYALWNYEYRPTILIPSLSISIIAYISAGAALFQSETIWQSLLCIIFFGADLTFRVLSFIFIFQYPFILWRVVFAAYMIFTFMTTFVWLQRHLQPKAKSAFEIALSQEEDGPGSFTNALFAIFISGCSLFSTIPMIFLEVHLMGLDIEPTIVWECFWRLVWGMAFIFCQGYTHENTSIVIISTSWVALFSMMLLRFRTKTLPKASFARDYVKDLFYKMELIWFACRIGFMKSIAFIFCTGSFLLVAFFPDDEKSNTTRYERIPAAAIGFGSGIGLICIAFCCWVRFEGFVICRRTKKMSCCRELCWFLTNRSWELEDKPAWTGKSHAI